MGKFINLVLHARRSGPRMGQSKKEKVPAVKTFDPGKMLRYGRI